MTSLETRERILRGAATALAERGLREATVADILLAADVSRRTYYLQFRSKEDVLLALYERVADGLAEAVQNGAGNEPDLARRLFAGIGGYLDHQRDGGALLVLLQAEAIRPGSHLAAYREATLDRLVLFLDAQMRDLTGADLDPLVYRALLLATEGLVIDLQRRGPFGSVERDRVAGVMRPMFLQVLANASMLPSPPTVV